MFKLLNKTLLSNQALLDRPVATAHLAKTVLWDPLAHPDPPAHQASQVAMAPAETQAVTPKATTRSPASVAKMANRVVRVPLARPVPQARTGSQVKAVPEARPDPRVRTARMASRATRVPLAHPANRERRACAPNTALWTAASFSKMAPGDKTGGDKRRLPCLAQKTTLLHALYYSKYQALQSTNNFSP